jgi:hypothetical protein
MTFLILREILLAVNKKGVAERKFLPAENKILTVVKEIPRQVFL